MIDIHIAGLVIDNMDDVDLHKFIITNCQRIFLPYVDVEEISVKVGEKEEG